MRLKFLLATIASHMVAPLPVHAIDALLGTVLWLAARTLFVWYMGTPRPFSKAFTAVKAQIAGVVASFGRGHAGAGHAHWHLGRGW